MAETTKQITTSWNGTYAKKLFVQTVGLNDTIRTRTKCVDDKQKACR